MNIIAAAILASSLVLEGAASARLHVLRPDGSTLHASATCCASWGQRRLLATARHVVQDIPPGSVRTVIWGPRHATFDVVNSADGQDDVALIVTDLPIPPLPCGNAAQGANVASLGYDHGGWLRPVVTRCDSVEAGVLVTRAGSVPGRSGGGLFSRGRLVGVCSGNDSATGQGIYTRAGSVPGRSGGGLFHRGRLVGVCSGYDDETGQGIYTRAGVVRELLRRVR